MRQLSVSLLVVLLGGCFSWTAIKPSELPKLNGASVTPVRGAGRPVMVVTVAHLETPEGRLVEVKGESDARVTRPTGAPLVFKHPVLSSVEGEALTIQSASLGKTTIPLGQIQRLEVSQYEPVRTTLAMAGLGLLAGLLTIAILSP